MTGTVAITDPGWYHALAPLAPLDEVNFWKPSAYRAFRAPEFSPFLFKLPASHDHAICGFGYFFRYRRLPIWLAWDAFGERNGCADLDVMRRRIEAIRERMRFRGDARSQEIGCILLVQPTFFPPDRFVAGPADWKPRTQVPTKYDLSAGEGKRVWEDCLATAAELGHAGEARRVAESTVRYAEPMLVRPRLGQGTFRIAVTDAYERACAVTGEHSLPALDAAHIRSYGRGGEHETRNGLLLRADLHRLFDKGYVTVTPALRFEVSPRLREEFENGRTYYPLHGRALRTPGGMEDQPDAELLRWHSEEVYVA